MVYCSWIGGRVVRCCLMSWGRFGKKKWSWPPKRAFSLASHANLRSSSSCCRCCDLAYSQMPMRTPARSSSSVSSNSARGLLRRKTSGFWYRCRLIVMLMFSSPLRSNSSSLKLASFAVGFSGRFHSICVKLSGCKLLARSKSMLMDVK